ncbi:MAG: hypothetical protein L3J44_00030 [Campylobacteraceae bacterium]|nr:hypothetical protein [Campylobacteraceae bacterium]
MRFIVILFIQIMLFANSYDFDEYKYVSAVSSEFHKSGHIDIQVKRTIIIYKQPSYKKIIKTDTNVSIEDSSGSIYHLKGKANFYAKSFIDVMTRLGNFDKLKSNPDFDVQKDGDAYYLTFKAELADQISKAKVTTKNSKVLSFKMYMPNDDTIEIVKKR